MTRRTTFVVLALAAAVALTLGYYWQQRSAESTARQTAAAALLALRLPDSAGSEQALAQWQGKVLVVNFWATWCGPCREEMPEFVRLQQQYGTKGLQFVGIAVDDADKVRQFASDVHLNYPALIGGYGAMELSRALGNSVMALPFTVVVGRGGGIELTQLGPLKPAQIGLIMDKLQ